MVKLASGIRDGGSDVNTEITNVCKSALSLAKSLSGDFKYAGEMMAVGLARGIGDGGYGVKQAAYNIAKAAAQAARDAVRVASPSKVFREIGDFMGEGMVIGLMDYSRASSKAGAALGNSATDGLRMAISKVGDYLDIDTDLNPTITPVIDMSNVESGVGQINRLLGGVTPNSVLGQVNVIDKIMDSTGQNGSFDDVIKAIDRLRSGLNEIGRPTYNVNGITYDDGTNVANAVGALTRAIRLEGRV